VKKTAKIDVVEMKEKSREIRGEDKRKGGEERKEMRSAKDGGLALWNREKGRRREERREVNGEKKRGRRGQS